MLKSDLIKDYEEIMIKLALCSSMEIEGEDKEAEVKRLSYDSVYAPTPSGMKRVLKSFDKHNCWNWTKHLFSAKIPVFYKISTVLCGILLLVLIIPTSVSANKPGFWGFIQSIQQEFALVGGKTEEKATEVNTDGWVPANWTDGYIPTSIPQGFELVELKVNKIERKINFSNKSGDCILFVQNLSEEYFFQDTEDVGILTRQLINGNDAFITEKNELFAITFEQEGFIIKVSGINVELETLIKFAESIQPVN